MALILIEDIFVFSKLFTTKTRSFYFLAAKNVSELRSYLTLLLFVFTFLNIQHFYEVIMSNARRYSGLKILQHLMSLDFSSQVNFIPETGVGIIHRQQ